MSKPLLLLLLALAIGIPGTTAYAGETPIDIFGYFQTDFEHWTAFQGSPSFNSFNVQQLNLMLRKELSQDWAAFVNFEVLNSYSSARGWGSLRLEEAWVRYRRNERLNLKLGLQIPIFNHLNEIRNRSPLLPYIIRPLVYEESLSEVIGRELFVPDQAFVQVYGFLPTGKIKIDYAAYVGNSPNINGDPVQGQTGVDTTVHVLVGGRAGVRVGELKAGVSSTYTNDNQLAGGEQILGGSPDSFAGIYEIRVGADLSYRYGPLSFEGEFIGVVIEDAAPEMHVDQQFYYGTLGYHLSDHLFLYGSYWLLKSDAFELEPTPGEPILSPLTRVLRKEEVIEVPTLGLSYALHDRLIFKAQYAPINVQEKLEGIETNYEFRLYAIALSVLF